MEQVRIDLVPSGVTPNAHASQFDFGRVIRFLLYNGGTAYTLAGTETIKVDVTAPDGTETAVSVTNTSSNYVDFVTTDGLLPLAGLYPCEISITQGSDVIGSKNFNLRVEKDAYDGAGIRSVTVGPADICSFETTLPEALPYVKSYIEAVQSGSGAPYPAGGGNNKLPLNDGTYSLNTVTVTISNGKATVSGTATGSGGRLVRLSNVFTLKAGTYYIKGNTALSGLTPFLNRDSDNTTVNNGDDESFTLSVDTEVFFGFNIINGYTYGGTAMPMVNPGSSALPWEPYSNVRPINGFTEMDLTRCGVNLWDEELEEGGIDTTTGETIDNLIQLRSKNFTTVKPSTDYYYKAPAEIIYARIYFYDASYNLVEYRGTSAWLNHVITTRADACYMKFVLNKSEYGNTYNHDISFNYPSTDTNYHAYTGTVYNVSWSDEAGTVYGGYVWNTNGVWWIMATFYNKALGDLNWSYNSGYGFYCSKDSSLWGDYKPKAFPNDETATLICTEYLTETYAHTTGGNYNNTIAQGVNYMAVSDNRFTDAAAFKTAMASVYIAYELATPLGPYQLSGNAVQALIGTNNVYSNTGEAELTYLEEG